MRTEWVARRAGRPDARRRCTMPAGHRHRGDGVRRGARAASSRRSCATRWRAAGWSSRRTSTTPTSSPWASASRSACKVNANIGNSAGDQRRRGRAPQAQGLAQVRRRHGDGPVDRRRHRRHPRRHHRQLARAHRHGARLPGAQGAQEGRRTSARDDFIDMLEHQAKQGVDYFTIHAGVLARAPAARAAPHHGHRVARRLDHGAVDDRAQEGEPLLRALGQGARHLRPLRRDHQRGRRPAPRLPGRRERRRAVRRARDAGRAHAARLGEGRAGDDRGARATCRSTRSR